MTRNPLPTAVLAAAAGVLLAMAADLMVGDKLSEPAPDDPDAALG